MGALVACLSWVGTLAPARLVPIYLAPDETLVHYYEGEGGSIAVTRQAQALSMRMNNLYTLGTSGAGLVVRRRSPLRLVHRGI